jgi:competence protein ComFC
MANIHPTRIPGRWKEGYALDYHTISSEFVGHDEYGHPRFETRRSELGELLYRLKYSSDTSVIDEIGAVAVGFLQNWKPGAEIIVPVPSSRPRHVQPVAIVAAFIAKKLGLPIKPEAVVRTRDIQQLKDIFGYDARVKLLEGVHEVSSAAVEGRKILLFDDLFRSSATMNSITEKLYTEGRAGDVFVLTLTRTRSRS